MRCALGLALLVACNEPGPSPKAVSGDCARVADQLASLETGGATAPAQRAPVVAKHRAACDAANLTAVEMACIGRAKDTWSAIGCAPRMFPEAKTDGVIDCTQVVARTRAASESEMPADTGSAGSAMLDKMMAIVDKACREDNWPEAHRRCVMSTRVGDMKGLQACNQTLPAELQEKLTQRMAAEIAR